MEDSKIITVSIKPQEMKLIESLKEAGHFYTRSDLLRAALYALADKILPQTALICANEKQEN